MEELQEYIDEIEDLGHEIETATFPPITLNEKRLKVIALRLIDLSRTLQIQFDDLGYEIEELQNR